MKKLALLVVILVLSGCATGAKLMLKDGPLYSDRPINIAVNPEQSLGVQVTPALEAGKVTVFEMPLPDVIVGAEAYPGRVRWNAWVVTTDGREVFAQIVLAGIYRTGEFLAYCIADSDVRELRDAKILPLSSLGNFAFSFEGKLTELDRDRFLAEAAYRREMVEKYGEPIGERELVQGFDRLVKTWNRYATKYHGELYIPLDQESVKKVAGINPGYNLGEKLILKNAVVLSINPVQTVASVAVTVFEAMAAKSQGWDYLSELPSRQQLGAIVGYIGQFRLELIRQLNADIVASSEKVAQLKSENDWQAALLEERQQSKLSKQAVTKPAKVSGKGKKR